MVAEPWQGAAVGQDASLGPGSAWVTVMKGCCSAEAAWAVIMVALNGSYAS